jgi:hypothetical protein
VYRTMYSKSIENKYLKANTEWNIFLKYRNSSILATTKNGRIRI